MSALEYELDGQRAKNRKLKADLVAARAEIERLKGKLQARDGECKGKAEIIAQLEAERDEARAQVAAAYAYGWQDGNHPDAVTMPADSQSALEAYGREKVRDGMRRAADLYPQGIGAIIAAMEKEGEE